MGWEKGRVPDSQASLSYGRGMLKLVTPSLCNENRVCKISLPYCMWKKSNITELLCYHTKKMVALYGLPRLSWSLTRQHQAMNYLVCCGG